MPKIMPCLWIDDRIEEMVNFYVTTFKDAEIRSRTPGPGGSTLTMTFRLRDQEYMALNGGPGPLFKFNESISFSVDCADQAEIDYFWNALTADGGEESMCGWLKDKYGLSWQIVPYNAMQMVWDTANPEGSARAQQAMFKMRKLIIADLEAARDGR